ncbi:MAG: hypothetical protein BWK76_08150 [Desulfobulbaceae bacterium A2]|nr:MAG: hypothetical protein BWK76_08150 [Desulfobulbaceae bacterium A2]
MYFKLRVLRWQGERWHLGPERPLQWRQGECSLRDILAPICPWISPETDCCFFANTAHHPIDQLDSARFKPQQPLPPVHILAVLGRQFTCATALTKALPSSEKNRVADFLVLGTTARPPLETAYHSLYPMPVPRPAAPRCPIDADIFACTPGPDAHGIRIFSRNVRSLSCLELVLQADPRNPVLLRFLPIRLLQDIRDTQHDYAVEQINEAALSQRCLHLTLLGQAGAGSGATFKTFVLDQPEAETTSLRAHDSGNRVIAMDILQEHPDAIHHVVLEQDNFSRDFQHSEPAFRMDEGFDIMEVFPRGPNDCFLLFWNQSRKEACIRDHKPHDAAALRPPRRFPLDSRPQSFVWIEELRAFLVVSRTCVQLIPASRPSRTVTIDRHLHDPSQPEQHDNVHDVFLTYLDYAGSRRPLLLVTRATHWNMFLLVPSSMRHDLPATGVEAGTDG